MVAFNRPQLTKEVLLAVKEAKPTKLFLVIDGPRSGNQEDERLTQQVKDLFDEISWPCEVHRKYRNENYGCGKGMMDAISWFFEHVESGIILEDDCVPCADFFAYAAEALEHYRDDERVMHINGNNFAAPASLFDEGGAKACNLAQVWGWATWARAWKQYQSDLILDKAGKVEPIEGLSGRRWSRLMARYVSFPESSWDFRWQLRLLALGGLCVVPPRNLISNIGFGSGATHTTNINSPKSSMAFGRDEGEINLPDDLKVDPHLNAHYAKWMLDEVGLKAKIKILLAFLLKKKS